MIKNEWNYLMELEKERIKNARKTAEALFREHLKKEFPKLDVESIQFKWED